MKKVLLFFLLLFPLLVTFAQEKDDKSSYSFFHSDISNYKYYFCDSCKIPLSSHSLSINFLLGISENEYGFVVGTIGNGIRNNAYGIQIAGLSNFVDNQGIGLAISGLYNNYKSYKGIQIAGFNNADKLFGIQLGGFNNADKLLGIQLGGFNGAKIMRGIQFGLENGSEDIIGIQIGFGNESHKSQKLSSLQIGIYNKGESGFQIGIFNESENNPYSLGLINNVKSGRMNLGFSVDEIGSFITQFRSGSRLLYGIIGLGYNFKSRNEHFVLQGGVGAHINFSSKFRVDLELSAEKLSRSFGSNEKDKKKYEEELKAFDFMELHKYSLGVFPSFLTENIIEFFGGPTINYLNTKALENERLIPSSHIWRDFSANSISQIYVGYTLGIRYVLRKAKYDNQSHSL
jgi:hypothetical protein